MRAASERWAVAVGMGAAGNNKICSLIIPNCYTLALSYLNLLIIF
jgi:hypothetical protein